MRKHRQPYFERIFTDNPVSDYKPILSDKTEDQEFVLLEKLNASPHSQSLTTSEMVSLCNYKLSKDQIEHLITEIWKVPDNTQNDKDSILRASNKAYRIDDAGVYRLRQLEKKQAIELAGIYNARFQHNSFLRQMNLWITTTLIAFLAIAIGGLNLIESHRHNKIAEADQTTQLSKEILIQQSQIMNKLEFLSNQVESLKANSCEATGNIDTVNKKH